MSGLIEFLNMTANTWASWVLPIALQAAALGLVVLVAVRFRRVSAHLRYALLLLVLAKFVMPPMAAMPFGIASQFQFGSQVSDESPAELPAPASRNVVTITQAPTTDESVASVATGPSLRERLERAGLSEQQDPGMLEPASATQQVAEPVLVLETFPVLTLWAWVLIAHVVGSVIVLLAAFRAAVRLRNLIRQAEPICRSTLRHGEEATKDIRFVVSNQIDVPFSCGVFRKTVVLPTTLIEQLTESQLDAVLLHEVAHHRRWDLFVNWLQIFATALWWFHPIMWLTNRELRRVREECCDDRLLSRGEVTDEVYSEALVAVARLSGQRSRSIPITVSMADSRHPLSDRLERIMDSSLRRRDGLGFRSLLLLALVGALVLPGLSRGGPAASAQDATAPQLAKSALVNAAITGFVLDRNGNAVAGADVFLLYKEAWSMSQAIGETVSGADGRFELQLKDGDYRITARTVFDVLASKDGNGLAHVQFQGEFPAAGFEVRLGPAKSATFRVRSPDGKPVANPSIKLAYVETNLDPSGQYRMSLQLPTLVPEALSATAGKSGVVTINGVDQKSINGIRVRADGFGEQVFTRFGGSGVPAELTLKPVGRIDGRVVAPEGVDVTKLQINLGTYGEQSGGGELESYGSSQSKPDKNGRFTIPAIATGTIKGRVVVPSGFRGAESLPTGLVVTSGNATEVVVKIKPAVKVRRRLVTHDDGDPVPNVLVSIEGHGLDRDEVTDADGWFTVWLKPNAEYHTVFDVPYEFLSRPMGSRSFGASTTKVGRVDAELAPLEFRRAKTITGVVVNQAGEPQEGVRVLGDWQDPDANGGVFAFESVNAKASATTDAEGQFSLRRVHPEVDAKLLAMKHGVVLSDGVVVPQRRDEARIKLRKQNLVALNGQIRVPDEVQSEKLQVVLFSNFSGTKSDNGRIRVGNVNIRPNGQFSTGPNFPDEYAYRVVAFVNNARVGETKWIVPKEGTSFAPFRIASDSMKKRTVAKKRPRAELKGRVLDLDGQPVGNADVVAWYLGERRRLKTDADGWYTLPNVSQLGGAWVFVDAEGFRYAGRYVTRLDGDHLRLVRKNEPDPRGPMRTLQTDEVPDELLKRVHALHASTLEEYLKRPGFQEFRKDRARQLFARVAPVQAAEFVKGRIRDQRARIEGLARTDLAEALRVTAEQAEGDRLWTYSNILRRRKKLTREQKRQVIDAARPLIPDAPEDLTHWAAYMRANGLVDEANKLFARAMKLLPEAGASDRASFTRGYFAWSYAEIDYRKSLKIIEGVADESDRTRYLKNIAHELADSNPTAAVEVLDMMEQQDPIAYKLVATMGPQHGIAARRLAYRIQDPRYRAHALAWIAGANPKAKDARRLLRKAFGILVTETNAGDKTGRQVRNSLTTAVAMLPIVERVAPDEMREYFWRALSIRRNVAHGSESRALGPHGEGQTLRFADPVLALALSRYDKPVARTIALDPDDETLDLPAEDGPFRLFAALAVLDPKSAVKTVEGLPTDTDKQLKAKLEACQQLGGVLTSTVRERWKSVIKDQYYLRDPKQVDF